MRMTFLVVATLFLLPTALPGGDKGPSPTLVDDWKALQASAWVNEKAEAAWAKLPESYKKGYGNKGWKKVDVKFYEAPGKAGPGGTKSRVDIEFTAAGQEKASPTLGNLTLALQEEKGARYFVLKGHADVEYKIQYSLKDGKLTLNGIYFDLNPDYGSPPTIFDGEFTPVAVKKK